MMSLACRDAPLDFRGDAWYRMCAMEIKYTYWRDDGGWYIGYLNEYPDQWTQGETLEELKHMLRDLQKTFADPTLTGLKHEAVLEFA